MNTPAFSLGVLVATPQVLAEVSLRDIKSAVDRHMRCDWDELDIEDRQANDDALRHGDRILSAYHSATHVKFWIITEQDRSVTTILLPSEY